MNDRRTLLAALAAMPAALAGRAVAGGDEVICPEIVGRRARFIGPDDVVTMDYDPERVNIHHDGNYVITRIDYG